MRGIGANSIHGEVDNDLVREAIPRHTAKCPFSPKIRLKAGNHHTDHANIMRDPTTMVDTRPRAGKPRRRQSNRLEPHRIEGETHLVSQTFILPCRGRFIGSRPLLESIGARRTSRERFDDSDRGHLLASKRTNSHIRRCRCVDRLRADGAFRGVPWDRFSD